MFCHRKCSTLRTFGFKTYFAWRETCRASERAGQATGSQSTLSQSLSPAAQSQPSGFLQSLSKSDPATCQAATVCLLPEQQAEIETKHRWFPAQTARRVRAHQSVQLVMFSSAHQRQHEAAVDACITLANTAESQSGGGARSACGSCRGQRDVP